MPIVLTECKVVPHGEFAAKSEWLAFADPIYYPPPDPMIVHVNHWGWASIHVFTVEDSRGVRALVITDGGAVPPELLAIELHGAYVKYDQVGVDSGQMCVAYDTEGVLYACHTYDGDGLYPIVAWGADGRIRAFAVLLDARYYDFSGAHS